MFLLPSSSERYQLNHGFSKRVDFCIWVLEIDGLQIPPFNFHSDGNGLLRSQGMDGESWQSWVKNIVIKMDNRLSWQVQDIQSAITNNLQELRHFFALPNQSYWQGYPDIKQALDNWQSEEQDNLNELRSSLEKYHIWKNQQYEKAVAQLEQLPAEVRQISSHAPPPEFWCGKPQVKEQLRELWQSYSAIISRQQFDAPTGKKNTLLQQLKPFLKHLGVLDIYVVCYPEVVEYLVPPVSAILSVSPGLPYNHTFGSSVLCAAQTLVQML